MLRLAILLAFLSVQPAAFAQLKFEVASVKVAAPRSPTEFMIGNSTGGPGTSSPERISWRATILGSLIYLAYGVKNSQYVAPSWVKAFEDENTRYDITATMPPGTTKEQMGLMIRDLLEDRFGLKSHRELQERTIYTISIAKGGSKLTVAAAIKEAGVINSPRPAGGWEISTTSTSMNSLASALEGVLRGESAQVFNRTSLTGLYEFKVPYADLNVGTPDVGLPALTTALEQDLGLKLEKRKEQIEILVVDHIEKVPTAN